jgi:hypothetical protein
MIWHGIPVLVDWCSWPVRYVRPTPEYIEDSFPYPLSSTSLLRLSLLTKKAPPSVVQGFYWTMRLLHIGLTALVRQLQDMDTGLFYSLAVCPIPQPGLS